MKKLTSDREELKQAIQNVQAIYDNNFSGTVNVKCEQIVDSLTELGGLLLEIENKNSDRNYPGYEEAHRYDV